MAKTAVSQWDTTAANNTDVGGIPLGEGAMLPSNVNNAFREIMAQIASAGLVTGWTAASASSATTFAYFEDTDNGTNKVTIVGPASVASDKTATLTDADGLIVTAPADPNADRLIFWDDSAGRFTYITLTSNLVISGTELRVYELHGIALSDETTAITTGTGKGSFSLPYAFTLVGVYVTLNTASSSGTPTFDFNEAGVSCLSTKVVIDANEFTGGSSGYQGTAAGAAVISDSSLAAFAQLTWDIDVAGTGAKGAKAYIIGYRP